MISRRFEFTKPVVFIMMGLPGAGKTHTAAQLSKLLGAFHIEVDEFRSELFDSPDSSESQNVVSHRLAQLMLRKLLSIKTIIVYDAENNLRAKRQQMIKLAKAQGYESVIIWVQTDPETSYNRASKRDKRKPLEKFSVSIKEPDFEQAIKHIQVPERENFIVISGKHLFNTQLAAIKQKLLDLELIKPVGLESLTPRPTQVSQSRFNQQHIKRRLTLR